MNFETAIFYIILLVAIYGPMAVYIAFEMSRAPLLDDAGKVISEPELIRVSTAARLWSSDNLWQVCAGQIEELRSSEKPPNLRS
jgi:hypothetical protein